MPQLDDLVFWLHRSIEAALWGRRNLSAPTMRSRHVPRGSYPSNLFWRQCLRCGVGAIQVLRRLISLRGLYS